MQDVSKVKPGRFSPTCLPPQGKDDFERQQKELLDKENIIKQSQVQLGQEQVRLSLSFSQDILALVRDLYLYVILYYQSYSIFIYSHHTTDTHSC